MLYVLAWVAKRDGVISQRTIRFSVGSVCGMPTWVTCNVDGVDDALACKMCQWGYSGWCSNMGKIIVSNVGGVL